MTDERFVELVQTGYTCRQIAAMMHRSHASAQARAQRLGISFARAKPPRCRVCGETRAERFGRQKERCLDCWSAYRRERNQQRRRQIIEALGGCCAACGYDRYLAALHVHHVDPSKKDPSARRLASLSWERVQRELEHCILLCANCHMGLHHGEHSVDVEPTAVSDSTWRLAHRFPVVGDALDPEPAVGTGYPKLTDQDLEAVRSACAAGMSQRAVAAECGISQQEVSRLVRGKRRTVAG